MARPNAFGIKIDVSELEGFADKLAGLTPEKVGAMMVDAINETADSAYALSRKAILSGINLTDAYVQSHMGIERATVQNPKATIVAYGDREHMTALSHYGAMQLQQSAKHRNRSQGDTPRGIPAGSKSAGVSVQVAETRKPIKSKRVFIAPNILDSEDNPFVFKRLDGKTRTGKSKLKRLMGPSVYQLFRVAGAQIEDQVYGDLERAVVDSAERQFLKEFS